MSLRRITLVLPGLIGDEGLLRSQRDALERVVSEGKVFRIATLESPGLDETDLLGVRPGAINVAQGPLTLSALRSDPPERSVHFHLSLASVTDSGRVAIPSDVPTQAELEEVLGHASSLNTRLLTVVGGEGFDHGLVWENGSLELGTTSIQDAEGRELTEVQPEGDGEAELRRLIDDSVNLLSETDFNKARRDQGKSPLNLLWPWGQGFRSDLPNLALRRGEIVHYESRSLRLDGLVRMVGYRHGSRQDFGRRLQTDWRRLRQVAKEKDVFVVLAENIAEATSSGRWDEAEEMLATMVREIVLPVTDGDLVRFTLLAPGTEHSEGLGLCFDSEARSTNSHPFDERVFEDRQVNMYPLWESVANALRP